MSKCPSVLWLYIDPALGSSWHGPGVPCQHYQARPIDGGPAMYHGYVGWPYRQGLTLARDGLARGFGHMG